MAQLNLNLPESDVEAMRRLAHERGMRISEFVRDAVLGTIEVELAPESVERLNAYEAMLGDLSERLEGFVRAAEALRNRVTALEGADLNLNLDPVLRRLERLEEMAGL